MPEQFPSEVCAPRFETLPDCWPHTTARTFAQFWALTRPHAELVAWEEPLFSAFRKHCISTYGQVPGCERFQI